MILNNCSSKAQGLFEVVTLEQRPRGGNAGHENIWRKRKSREREQQGQKAGGGSTLSLYK